jgi:hypothetical protein
MSPEYEAAQEICGKMDGIEQSIDGLVVPALQRIAAALERLADHFDQQNSLTTPQS